MAEEFAATQSEVVAAGGYLADNASPVERGGVVARGEGGGITVGSDIFTLTGARRIPGPPLPLVIEPASEEIDAVAWATTHCPLDPRALAAPRRYPISRVYGRVG